MNIKVNGNGRVNGKNKLSSKEIEKKFGEYQKKVAAILEQLAPYKLYSHIDKES